MRKEIVDCLNGKETGSEKGRKNVEGSRRDIENIE
jgi:hypothetical protein